MRRLLHGERPHPHHLHQPGPAQDLQDLERHLPGGDPGVSAGAGGKITGRPARPERICFASVNRSLSNYFSDPLRWALKSEGMRSAHRTRCARTFAAREVFFPKMRFPGKMIEFHSASAEAELCEAFQAITAAVRFYRTTCPGQGISFFSYNSCRRLPRYLYLKLLYRACQVSYSPRVQGPQALVLSVRFPESGLPPGRA